MNSMYRSRMEQLYHGIETKVTRKRSPESWGFPGIEYQWTIVVRVREEQKWGFKSNMQLSNCASV